MKISIIVCGRFHYHNYVKFMRGWLEKFYYSYAINYSFGVDNGVGVNIFIKEYIVSGWIKFFGRGIFFDGAIKLSHFFWREALKLYFKPSDVNLFMLHGNCLEAIVMAKNKGAMVVVEAVNSHPDCIENKIIAEAARINLSKDDFAVNNKEKILLEASLADYILCPSEAVFDSFIKNGFESKKLIKIPYGAKNKIKANKNSRKIRNIGVDEKYKVLCVGQISLRKGQINIFEAIGHDERFEVTLVGSCDPDYFKILKKYNFNYIKKVNHEDMLNFMKDFDVFVLPSIEDGFAMVVTEAMEVGVPVVVSKYAGAADVVSSCGGGIVVDPIDHNGIKDALIMCCNGRSPSVWRDYYSWEDYSSILIKNIEDKYFEWIKDALHNSTPPVLGDHMKS